MILWDVITKLSDSTNVKLFDYNNKLLEVYDGKNGIEQTELFAKDVDRMWIDNNYICIGLIYKRPEQFWYVKKEAKDRKEYIKCDSKEEAFDAFVSLGKRDVVIEHHFYYDVDINGEPRWFVHVYNKMTRRTVNGNVKYYFHTPTAEGSER